MHKSLRLLRRLVVLCGLFAFINAAHSQPLDPAVENAIAERLQQAQSDIHITNVQTTPLPGIFQAQVVNGPTIYVTRDGNHFIAGDLYRVHDQQLVNLTETGRSATRKAALAQIDPENMIIFSPEGETKTHITVFTDIDCGYCRKLHQEVPKLNEMGVEVRYLAFPRAGINSNSYRKLATTYCAKNPQQTLTQLKSGESVPLKTCDNNPVAEQYHLGQRLGVSATPALILESGELQLGYMPAAQLANRLGL